MGNTFWSHNLRLSIYWLLLIVCSPIEKKTFQFRRNAKFRCYNIFRCCAIFRCNPIFHCNPVFSCNPVFWCNPITRQGIYLVQIYLQYGTTVSVLLSISWHKSVPSVQRRGWQIYAPPIVATGTKGTQKRDSRDTTQKRHKRDTHRVFGVRTIQRRDLFDLRLSDMALRSARTFLRLLSSIATPFLACFVTGHGLDLRETS